ncbi:hypothetical protein CO704_06135 [Cedecea neteri]|uniref:Lipoprotein n=2 Tax=Cedecea neteri TaxID=158822 RepID=A0A291DVD5_9ENTR|nr:hypothetical protein CO704_06135 [Cedecea neteri]
MYFRAAFLLAGVLSLTGCVVGDMDSSNYHYVPWIQLFQKVDATGQTNIRERKEALYSCGVDRKENLDDKNWGLNAAQGNETLKEIVRRNDKIYACMKSKGYQVYGFSECGPLKKPSGLCPN